MDLDHKLCYCFHVSKRKVINFVKQTRPRRASQITECFGAGSGCGWCVPFLKEIHRQIMGGEAIKPDAIQPADYEAMRQGYIAGLKDGSRKRNVIQEPPAPTVPRLGEEVLDYTRYFSRSRPEPPPEDVSGQG